MKHPASCHVPHLEFPFWPSAGDLMARTRQKRRQLRCGYGGDVKVGIVVTFRFRLVINMHLQVLEACGKNLGYACPRFACYGASD